MVGKSSFFQDVFSMLLPKTPWDGMSAFCFDWYPVVVPLFFQDGYSS